VDLIQWVQYYLQIENLRRSYDRRKTERYVRGGLIQDV